MKRPVFFVAFQEQDNLGVGYLASVVRDAGYPIKILDFRLGCEVILEEILRQGPLIVGFSIIFQYHISRFRELLDYLRRNSVTCHFCAGGHYPSLRFRQLMDDIPQIDSVVLFEGEYTFRELVQTLDKGGDWQQITGVAFRRNGTPIANPLRPLEDDLDNFPTPARAPLRTYALGKKYATLLASRGCVHNCAYCSIRTFYSQPPGRIKRMRRPDRVVREMELLHQQMGASVFMFQDDDFPVAEKLAKNWIHEFCDLLREKKLADRILFKINCRPDEVEEDLFRIMRSHGLFLVYLGIESGTDEGLRLMNKRATVQDNLTAVDILNRLDIDADYGFMLFDPGSTFASVRSNLQFLDAICHNGFMPINFCKMLPYAGTQVESQLAKAGRLKGEAGFIDYGFLDESLDSLFSFVSNTFFGWLMDHDGLLNLQRWARYNLAIYHEYFPPNPQFDKLRNETRAIVDESNRFMLGSLARICDVFEQGEGNHYDQDMLSSIQSEIDDFERTRKKKLGDVLSGIEALAERCETELGQSHEQLAPHS